MHRNPRTQVWKPEVSLAIATEGIAEQREQARILLNWNQPSVAGKPAFGRHGEGITDDIANEWVEHGC